jgi:sugar phosphate isomerase/epimerase
MWGCGSTCEFHATDMKVVQQNIDTCRAFVQLAADLGGRGVKVRPNGLPAGVPVERTLEQIGRALQACGRAAADAGVEIWVEVHGRGTDVPQNMRTIMQHANHPAVGVCWNSNAADIRNGSIAEAFKLLQPWIKSCHIHDLYEDYPYRELFRALREINYDRWTLAEMPGMPTPAAAERFLRYYKAVWSELARA